MSGILLVCAGCERHVKNGDCICPFCGTKVACVAGSGAKVPPGISRAALLALGAAGALSTAMSGCFQALYGAPTGGGGFGGEGQATSATGQGGGQTASATGQGGAGGAGGAGGEVPDAGKD